MTFGVQSASKRRILETFSSSTATGNGTDLTATFADTGVYYYTVDAWIYNNGAGGADYSLVISADTTANHYITQRLGASSGVVTGERVSTNVLTQYSTFNGGAPSSIHIDLFFYPSGICHYHGWACSQTAAVNTPALCTFNGEMLTANVPASMTSITLHSSIAAGIGTGSRINVSRKGI